MAEVIGNIATPLEARKALISRETYFSFRLGEHHGKGKYRKTTWYDVRAKIPEEVAGLLQVGQLVRIRGRIEPQAFLKLSLLGRYTLPRSWTEFARLVKSHQIVGTSLVLLTSSVEPFDFSEESFEAFSQDLRI